MEKQYFNLGAGWVKQGKNGEYISCQANKEADGNGKVRLQAVNENGETVDISNFVIFYNKNKKKENHPDINLFFTLD